MHIDSSEEGVVRSQAVVAAGERLRPARCERPWLGASDQAKEVDWRDGESIVRASGGTRRRMRSWISRISGPRVRWPPDAPLSSPSPFSQTA
jgi:hypothetical protein